MKKIISKDILPFIFLPFAMISGTIFLISGLPISEGNFQLAIPMILIALFIFIIAIRKRVVFFSEHTNEITITWGKILPITLRKIPANNWSSFSITKEFPIGVFLGPTVKVYHLTPQWRLRGKTKTGKTVNLGRFKTESDAESWKHAIIK